MNYVFIGGVPRSGTSLVQKILGLNPTVSAGPEFDFIPDIIALYDKMKTGINNERQKLYYDEMSLKLSFRSFLDSLFQNRINKNTKLISEKTPINIFSFNRLIGLDNQFKFIFVVRDPRGIFASMKEVAKRANDLGTKVKVGRSVIQDLYLMGKYFREAYRIIKNHQENVFVIYYEDIIKYPENTIKKLCGFLNIEFYDNMLDTSKKNEMSYAIKNNYTKMAWYTEEMYDRKISEDGLYKWMDILTTYELECIEYYFSRQRFEFLKRYNFNDKGITYKIKWKYQVMKYRVEKITNK